MPINSVSTHSARNINRNSENPFGHYLATNVKTQGQVNVPAYSAIYDYSSDDKSLIISEMYEAYPGIEILGEPTGRYNCHSYAWYSDTTYNPYWIYNVEIYTNDVHTVIVSNANANARPGDIVVYYGINSSIVHSAIIAQINETEVICRSKWGPLALCEHDIRNVPEEYAIGSNIVYKILRVTPHEGTSSPSGSSTHTRTCTICNHTETLNCNYRYTYLYDDMHNATCVGCGRTFSGGMCSFTYTSNNNGTHTGVCACGNTKTSTCYAGSYTAYPNGRHGKNCSQCGYNMGSENCTYSYTYEGFGQHMAACSKCNANHLAECSPYHTYCGNGTDTHVHNIRCDDCDIPMYNGTESCTFSYKYNGSVNGQNTHVYTCASCGYIQSGPTQCSYIGSKPCRFCGTPKGGSVLNSLEEDFSEN